MSEINIEPRKPFIVRERMLILLSAALIILIILLMVLGGRGAPASGQQTLRELAEQKEPLASQILVGVMLALVVGAFLWLVFIKSHGGNALPDTPPTLAAWRLEDIAIVFFITAVCSQAVLIYMDGSFRALLGVDSAAKIVAVLVMFVLIERRGQDPRQTLGLDLRGGWGDCLRSFACFLVFLPVLLAVYYYWGQLVMRLQGESFKGSQEVVTQLVQTETGYTVIQIIVAAVFIAPIAEEMFFRGFLYGFLRKYVRPPIAMIFVGALFGLFHMPLAVTLPTGVLGMFFCYVYERTGRLAVPILLHAFYNLTQILVIMSYRLG